jgi:ribosomal protein S28E/S33
MYDLFSIKEMIQMINKVGFQGDVFSTKVKTQETLQ